MNRKYLAFDIETAKAMPADDYDWKSHRPLGISCAATCLEHASEPLIWHGGSNCRRLASHMNRREVGRLVDYLTEQVENGYTILTWNGVGFDFDVLAEESGLLQECRRLASNHVDMMFHVVCRLGYGVSLDSAARGMGLTGKKQGMTGASAPLLWAQGRRKEVLDYVAQDVRITLELAAACEARGFLRWITRSGRRLQMSLSNGWLTVKSAKRLPKPVTSWMSARWSRRRFTAWLR
jgi:hypothetical protein